MTTLRTDVLILGSGAAGLVAALKAREAGARVLVAGKGALGRGTCTAMAAGVFSCASAEHGPEAHRQATLEAGRGLNDEALVNLVVAGAPAALEGLRQLGAPLQPTPRGFAVGGASAGPGAPGPALAGFLRRAVRSRGIEELPGFHALELRVEAGAVAGARGLLADGTPAAVTAPSVVLAAGGACGLYARNDNPPGITGDGYALALRAGCTLRDLEFVQFYPVGLAEPGLPEFLAYPPYPPGARAVDAEGRDVLGELGDCRDLNDAIVRFRDTASLLFWRKSREGGVFLDLTAVEPERWTETFPLRVLGRSSFDLRRRPCRIAPIAHFSLGGVEVDGRMGAGVEGLFAAGEVVGGLHGANRLGGNALSECVVGGALAGASAAAHARRTGRPRGPAAEGSPPFAAGPGPCRWEYRELFRAFRAVAWERARVVRDEAGMRQGLASLAAAEADLGALVPRNGPEELAHRRLGSALLVLTGALEAGLLRRESRGAFFRSDCPAPDDGRWRRSVRVRLSGGRVRLEEGPAGRGPVSPRASAGGAARPGGLPRP